MNNQKALLTRLALNIINKCNQTCPWCFQGDWKKGPTRMMSIENVERLLKWKKWDDGFFKGVFLLGGEPTLHPRLLEILDLIERFNPLITKNLLTNLTCETSMVEEMVARRVIFFVNIDQFQEGHIKENQAKLLKNLEYLGNIPNDSFRFNVSVTVSDPGKDFTFLYKILKQSNGKIHNVRAATSCIGLNFNNPFQEDATDDYHNKVLEVIARCHEIDPSVKFSSECAVNGCMVSDTLFNRLKNYGYDLRFVCGEPVPNADILPDLSCHWCYALENIPGMKITNVLDYPDYNSMIQALYALKEKFNRQYSPRCEIQHCSHQYCKGPCSALNYYYATHNKKLTRIKIEK